MKKELLNSVIYQVYPRNFTKEGNFVSLVNKLDYIKDLGTDILYLLPINEIGNVNRKGDLGCPYSIKDYLKINEELGTLEDFKLLINETHARNMKIMIDIVFNHTSYDSTLSKLHPDWFFKDQNGKICSKCQEWSDVIDLDYKNNEELVSYLLNVIEFYIKLGVDGFRFDVVSLLGDNFFIRLQKEIMSKYPNIIFLGEAIDASFLNVMRKQFKLGVSDCELFNYGFDILYGYNAFNEFRNYLNNGDLNSLNQYKILLQYEASCVPINGLRLRCIENHDQQRLIEFTNNELKRYNLAAFSFFLKGPILVYNGLETKADHHLSLFTKDLLDLNIDENWFKYIKKLIDLKKSPLNLTILGSSIDTNEGEFIVVENEFENKENNIYGIFNFSLNEQKITSKLLKDGMYIDLISSKTYEIKNNSITVKYPLELKRL